MSRKPIKRLIALVIAVMTIVSVCVVPAFAAVPLTKDLTLYLIPNTHLDTAWQHPYPQVANNSSYGIRPMFRNSTDALLQGDYRFTTSASAHLKMLKDYYNEDNPTAADRLWTKTKQLVDEGKLDLGGGQIVEPDLNVPSGEALVRQSLYAQHFFMKNFTLNGQPYVARTGMVPDVFGFSGQMPQILFKSEMKYFVTSKVNWNGAGDGGGTAIGSSYDNFRTGSRNRDADIQYWQALDGESRVLSYFLYNDYNNTSPSNSIQNVFNQNWTDGVNFHGGDRNTGVRTAMAFYGGGDFGQGMNSGLSGTGGNSFRHHEAVAASTDGQKINVKTSTATQYFEETVANEDLSNLSYIDGEMYAEFHRGTYTSWARLKKYNRDNEILGESAEKAATIGFFTNSIDTNSQQRLEDGWYKILINQMHDVLPGSALAWQYYLTFNQEELAKNLFTGVLDNALAALAYRADTNVSGKPVFVYNDLSWPRDGEVTVTLRYDTLPEGNQVVIYDKDNLKVNPTKVVADTEKNRLTVTFMANGVPATGYKVFDVRAEAPVDVATPLVFDQAGWTIANERISVKFNPDTGYISSLKTLIDGNWTETFAQGVGTEGGELHVYKDCDEVRPYQNFDQWDLNRAEMNKEPDFIFADKPLSMTVICNTPEKVTVRVVKEWGGSEVAQDFTVFADSDRVDVHLAADWYQVKRLLKVSFPIAVDNDYATFETAFGAVQRPTNRDNAFGYYRYEVPVHKWSDVTDKSGSFGVSILNDAKYGNDVLRKVMSNGKTFVRSRITVARTPRAQAWAGNNSYPPVQPYVIDSARHEFNYSIYPHAGSWEDSKTVNKGLELNSQMTAFEAVKGPSNGLGASESFASSDKSNVIISALKNQYDTPENKNTIILRVYESSGRDTDDVSITLPGNIVAGGAKEVNMLEHDFDEAHGYKNYVNKNLVVAGNKVQFNIKKYEVLTIQVELTPSTLTPLALPQESVALAFNSQGVTSNDNRRAGFLEGTGSGTTNNGRSMPKEHWPEGNLINYQGIKFNLGAPDANNFMNGVEGADTVTVTPAQGYSKVYIVGASVASSGGTANNNNPFNNDSATGIFTVNYTDGTSTQKEITLSSWRSELSGWNRTAFMDDHPYVNDSVAHFNGHYHTSSGASNSSEMYESDNYLFVYDMSIDDTKTVSSIQIPVSDNIKIAAMTLAKPVDGYGKVFDPTDADGSGTTAPTPQAVQNLRAEYDPTTNGGVPAFSNIIISWDSTPNAIRYRLYQGVSADFTPDSSNLLGEMGTTSFTHLNPTLSQAQINSGDTKFYYKVIAVGKANNPGDASDASNAIAPRNVDYALNIITSENNNRVRANRQQSSEQAFKAVNGQLSGTSNKWCATGVSTSNPAIWVMDLTGTDSTIKIDSLQIHHGGVESASYITSAFSLSYAASTTTPFSNLIDNNTPEGTWNTFNVTGNTSDVTVHSMPDGSADVRYVRLVVTAPTNSTDAATRIYEVRAMGRNPDFVEPAPPSTVRDAKIVQTPVLGDGGYFNKVHLAIDYSFYNQNSAVTEDTAKTELKWYKKMKDNYRDYYVLIPGSFRETIQTADPGYAYRCEITVWDSDGKKGQKVTVETTAAAPVNVLQGAALIDSTAAAATTATRLVDGVNGASNKWDVITFSNPGPHFATFDMGEVKGFNSLKVYHANSYAASGSYDADTALNTRDFDVSYSSDNVNWVTKEVRANYDPITTINLGGLVEARYVKINVITPSAYAVGEGTNAAELNYLSIRIGELEALYDESAIYNPLSPATLYEDGKMVPLSKAVGKTVDVKTLFYTEPVQTGNVQLIIATYAGNGELLNIVPEIVSFDAAGVMNCTVSFAVPADAASMKVFYWAGDGSLVPISEAGLVS